MICSVIHRDMFPIFIFKNIVESKQEMVRWYFDQENRLWIKQWSVTLWNRIEIPT